MEDQFDQGRHLFFLNINLIELVTTKIKVIQI